MSNVTERLEYYVSVNADKTVRSEDDIKDALNKGLADILPLAKEGFYDIYVRECASGIRKWILDAKKERIIANIAGVQLE